MGALVALLGLAGANVLAVGILRRGWMPTTFRARNAAEQDTMRTAAQVIAGCRTLAGDRTRELGCLLQEIGAVTQVSFDTLIIVPEVGVVLENHHEDGLRFGVLET